MSLVEIRSLNRDFGRVRAVRDLSFSFDAGDIFGFIGPNGAGKSTTMRILATLDLPTSGECRIGGLSTVDDADAVRRIIGYMPDSYGSYPNMTAAEYLDFFARAYGLAAAARRRAVDGIVDFCQLGGLLDKEVGTLSKGMKQRLCLGRCLISDPKVLVLDEPSAGLDPRARIEFRELLRLLAAQGKAVLVSSHILAELEEMCTRVAIIELGRLVVAGTVAEVKSGVRAAQAEQARAAGGHAQQVEIVLAAEHPRLREILAEQPGLSEPRTNGRTAGASFSGGEEDLARLLKRLVDAGLPVCRFSVREAGLEDAFMHMTEGKVQ